MKTSISEIVRTEQYLLGELAPRDHVVFEAQLIVDKEMRSNTAVHRLLHRLIRFYRRKKIKQEMVVIHERLFLDPSKHHFRESVLKYFKS